MHPDIGNIDPHFADIADRTARVGDIQPLGDVERRPLTAAAKRPEIRCCLDKIPYLCTGLDRMPLRACLERRGRAVSDSYLRNYLRLALSAIASAASR